MNSAKLNDWLQVLGLFGVMASLLFVGLQMKQTQEIAMAEAYSTRAGITIDMYGNTTGTPQYFSGTAKLFSGLRHSLTAEEYLALENFLVMQLTVAENIHFQYLSGFLPESHWQKNVADLDCHMSEPVFREFASYWSAREEFRVVLDAAIARGEAVQVSCWEESSEEPWPFFNPVEKSADLAAPGA